MWSWSSLLNSIGSIGGSASENVFLKLLNFFGLSFSIEWPSAGMNVHADLYVIAITMATTALQTKRVDHQTYGLLIHYQTLELLDHQYSF
ncbi:MAG: hypothetical protein Ct9H300mP28_35010 [Pseudomonadota bacterium]|nr:MAG: hypothetical protein Ct9H300mP28_35010 [Pseudomonadota bacterium]